jgi:hypothetical protein
MISSREELFRGRVRDETIPHQHLLFQILRKKPGSRKMSANARVSGSMAERGGGRPPIDRIIE